MLLQSPAGARADGKGGDELTLEWKMHATIIESRIAKLSVRSCIDLDGHAWHCC
jgi:hypothetical protein